MKKYIHAAHLFCIAFLTFLLVFSISIIFFPSLSYASTRITSKTSFTHGASWTKSGSPYIIEDSITIPQYYTLYIGPGVTVTASSTTANPISIFDQGDMMIAGTDSDPVTVAGLDNITFAQSNITISGARINLPNGMSMAYSTSTISSSTISGGSMGISARASLLNIANSTIENNDYGVYSYYVPPGPFLSALFGKSAFADMTDDPKQNHITISSSTISGNRKFGIYNATTNIIHAENNWWGSSDGPTIASSTVNGDGVYGPVDINPWISNQTFATSSITKCCSNVLFLPGIEASRLYLNKSGNKNSEGLQFATSTNQLWEPNRNDDVRNLFMDNSGLSINSSIYTKDIINNIFVYGIYSNFITMINAVVADKTINTWEPFPYDWRYGVDTIVTNPINYATTTRRLITDFLALASSSKTGKVTIVAHSDGGLVAKMLAEVLTKEGKSNLIDKVIMVAVPELGTPQAISSLLHGDGQDILGGLVLNQSVARSLGENSPGAYGLLPSKSYFSNSSASSNSISSGITSSIFQPVISFASSTIAGFNFSGYGQTISTYDGLRSFLAGIADHRAAPDPTITNDPQVLHTSMIDSAEKIHDTLDAFIFSSTTPVISLIGWGNATTKGIEYYQKISCSVTHILGIVFGKNELCTPILAHSASTTLFGDGTVVTMSAQAVNAPISKEYYFNLDANNKGKIIADDHATILNTDSGVAFVKAQITSSTTIDADSDSSENEETLPAYISSIPPTLADLHADNLIVTVHSPVELNMYDSEGRHTGPIPNLDPSSDLGRYETNIPGSFYQPNDDNTSITVPYGTAYTVALNGTGSGTFTLDTERDTDDSISQQTEFADMPVTPLLKAELVLATTTYMNATSSAGMPITVATTSQLLTMDFDGDGIIDASTTAGTSTDPTLYFRSMKSIIISLHLTSFREKVMCNKIDRIIDYIRQKKEIKIDEKSAETASQAIKDLQDTHWVFKNIDQSKKDRLINMFQSILDAANVS